MVKNSLAMTLIVMTPMVIALCGSLAGPDVDRPRVGDPGVTPADVGGVLGVRVLAVVDQKIGVMGECVPRDPLGLDDVNRFAEAGLVVGDIGERGVTVGDPVAERRSAVSDRRCLDSRAAELPLRNRGVEKGDLARKLTDFNR